MPVPRVVVFVAQGCHLCDAAVAAVREACGDAYAVVDVTGDPALEERYRERLPVVELDGEPVFTYFAHADRLRELLDR